MSSLVELHSDHQGKISWMRTAGTVTLLLLFGGLFFNGIEWGQAFVGALALIFGLKGTQKWNEMYQPEKGEKKGGFTPSQTE